MIYQKFLLNTYNAIINRNHTIKHSLVNINLLMFRNCGPRDYYRILNRLIDYDDETVLYVLWTPTGISATWCGTVSGWWWWTDSIARRTRTWICSTAGAATACPVRTWLTRIWRSAAARGTEPNRWKTPPRRPLKIIVRPVKFRMPGTVVSPCVCNGDTTRRGDWRSSFCSIQSRHLLSLKYM